MLDYEIYRHTRCIFKCNRYTIAARMDPLDQIRERLSLIDFIGETVKLKKTGRNFKGICPFHNEKTPSFVVSPERAIWHCFGCGKGGDCFSFLMELEHLDFVEALKILAERTGVKLERRPEITAQTKLREKLLEIHKLVEEYYHYILTKHKMGERARLYLKERGMTDALIATFHLGFAPLSWDNVARFLSKKGYTSKEIELSGLAIYGRTGLYDRFRSRIMFPLKDHRGVTMAFSGRVLDPKAKEAKYINSPETLLYIKGNTFYGLDITKEAIRESGSAVVVEGEFDVISSFAAGVTNVVAIKGSALTPAQVRLIKRFAEKILLALDQDAAGDAASRRGIELADQAGLDVRVVKIPLGKDPDEAARTGAHLWKKGVSESVPYYEFLIDSSFRRLGGSDAFSKKKITDELLPALMNIENTIVQAHYVKLLATKLELPEEKVMEALKKQRKPLFGTLGIESQPIKPNTHDSAEQIEEHLLGLVIAATDPKLALHKITESLDPSEFTNPLIKRIFCDLVDFSSNHPQIVTAEFVKSLPPECVPIVDKLYLTDAYTFTDEIQLSKELDKSILVAKRMWLRRKIKTLSTQMQEAQKSQNTDTVATLNEQLKETTTALKAVS